MDKAPVGAGTGGGGVGDSGKVPPHQINGYPRDPHVLRKFEAEEEDADGVELNLTLSMGGRFGIDPLEKKRLLRSSSIGGLAALPNFDDLIGRKGVAGVVGGGGGGGLPPLGRTVSLPVQTEDDVRKRKEMQSLRRLEAKRKRSEKQRNSNGRLVSSGKEADKKVGGEDDKSKVLHLPANGFPAGGWPAAAASQGSAGSQGSGSSGASDVEGRSTAGKIYL